MRTLDLVVVLELEHFMMLGVCVCVLYEVLTCEVAWDLLSSENSHDTDLMPSVSHF